MRPFRIGDQVSWRGRDFVVTGITPMSVSPPVIHLSDMDTGERLDVTREELLHAAGEKPAPAAEDL